jgi:large subunit ribosomal protein L29
MKETKPKDLRALSAVELKAKASEAREKLFELKLRKATRQVEDTSGLRALKRDIARFETLAHEKAKAAA